MDRDDDLGQKAGVKTPVVGRDAALQAAMKLALADPEEADTNAIFAAVKKLDELRASGIDGEVAVVCGEESRGFQADRKVRREVESVLQGSNYTGIVFVSDGGDDEQVLPVLQSIRPIASVYRIAIKHSRTVEETYMVLGRYLRMLVFETRYSRWFLGVPGLILLLAGVLIVSNRVFEAQLATLLILGGAFFVRGFGVDRSIAGILSQRPYGYIRLFSIMTGVLVLLVGISSGYEYMVSRASQQVAAISANPSEFLVYGAVVIGYFLKGALPLVWAGLAIYTTGTMLAHMVRGSVRAWRDAVVLVMLGLLYFPMDTFSTFLIGGQRESTILLVSYVLFGLAVIFGVTSTVYGRVRTRSSMAKE